MVKPLDVKQEVPGSNSGAAESVGQWALGIDGIILWVYPMFSMLVYCIHCFGLY